MIDTFFEWKGLEQHLLTFIKFYYSFSKYGAGDNLCVLNDTDVSTGSIYFCAEQCAENNDTLGLLICNLLTEFTFDELNKMYICTADGRLVTGNNLYISKAKRIIDPFFDWKGLGQHLATLIKFYYSLPEKGAGGYLHIVLDDGNVDPDSIYFCAKQCTENNDILGLLICNLLIEFSSEELGQRYERRWDRDN